MHINMSMVFLEKPCIYEVPLLNKDPLKRSKTLYFDITDCVRKRDMM